MTIPEIVLSKQRRRLLISDMAIHIPVMTNELLSHLSPQEGGCIVDCTVGTGGHALAIAERIGPGGHLVAIDRDERSLQMAKERLKDFTGTCSFVKNDFRNIDTILDNLGLREVDGMIFDLGISSFQLEDPQRGFSIRTNGPLDMRMDKDSRILACDLVNSLSEQEISHILRDFGQERWHNRIAHTLVKERTKGPIESTYDLSATVLKAIPRHCQHQKIHPATRTFQAFRIAVNRELEALGVALDKCIPYLKVGARLCIISFHSLEDKIVKEKFKGFSKKAIAKLIVKKPLRPRIDEVNQNPRARSARLRVIERAA